MKMTNRCFPPPSSVSLWDLPKSLCFIRAKWGFTLLSVCWLMKSQMQLLRTKRKATDQPFAFLIERHGTSKIVCHNLTVSSASYYLNNVAFFPNCELGDREMSLLLLKKKKKSLIYIFWWPWERSKLHQKSCNFITAGSMGSLIKQCFQTLNHAFRIKKKKSAKSCKQQHVIFSAHYPAVGLAFAQLSFDVKSV